MKSKKRRLPVESSEKSQFDKEENLFPPEPIDFVDEKEEGYDSEGSEASSRYSGIGEDEDSGSDIEELEETDAKVTIEHGVDDDHDTSDEEDLRNTVGNIPMQWYETFPHIGYDLDGKAIGKPIRNQDELDKFLEKMENPDYWKTIHDKNTARDHVLTNDELELIKKIKTGSFYSNTINPYEPYIDFFTHEKMIHPVTNFPEHKRSFTPSVLEKRKVGKIVHAIKMGWIKPRKPKSEEDDLPKFYDLWEESDSSSSQSKSAQARVKMHVPAPKLKLPGHEESCNPPPEYLPTEDEIEKWKEQDAEERKIDFIPQKYDSLRKVPQYSTYIQERFARCLDLYLCPRQRKMKVNVNPDDLIPNLPKPKDLQPFPTFQALCYRGHKSMVRTISVDPTGQWLASGSDDGNIRIWEVSSARCTREFNTPYSGAIKSVCWCPNENVCLLSIVVNEYVVIANPCVGDKLVYQATDNLLQSYEAPEEVTNDEEKGEKTKQEKSNAIIPPWKNFESGSHFHNGLRLAIKHPKEVSTVAWHEKGNYFAAVVPGNGHAQVFLHQLTKRRSQNPFSKCRGLVQRVLFHPTLPFFFVATQQYVRVYNLVKQQLAKKLMTNSKWISSLAIHPGGDNLLVGSYDCRLSWFDMDLSTKPYKTMRYHKRAIRACCFHRKYPLFASGADDGTVVVSHGMVYSDLMQNPLIVPVKVLKGHKVERNLGVLDCCFHPKQPWIFSSAADMTIRLFT